MQSKPFKISLAIMITFILVGCGVSSLGTPQNTSPDFSSRQEESKTFSNDYFAMQYPAAYQVSTDNLGIVTLSGPNGKIMVGNFEPDAASAPTPEMTQQQIDEFPKNIQYHGYEGKIASAIFYKTGYEDAKKELETIQNSIQLK